MNETTTPEMTATETVTRFLAEFGAALAAGDTSAASALFDPDASWRDLVAFTWNIVTLDGRAAIAAMLDDTLARVQPTHWVLDGEARSTGGLTEAWFNFETAVARGRGHVRLKHGRAWTLLTAMQELKGFEERQGFSRPNGVQHGAAKNRRTWLEQREAEQAELGTARQPFVLVVGGGQGGIALGARLRRLDVPHLVIDRLPRPGDQWRRRYKSLCLHDPVWYDHLPYLPFPAHWPIFTPKDQLGDWLEAYVTLMEVNFWGSTTCLGAHYSEPTGDELAGEWTVMVERDGQRIALRPKHLVLATGQAGVPSIPAYPGAGIFKGIQHHSSQHRTGEAFAGKRCVVIGSNNSAHDIAADLWENDAAVTMVQRSSTLVVRQETLRRMGRTGPYSEEAAQAGLATDQADLMVASMPYRRLADTQLPVWQRVQEDDRAFYDDLRAAGFMLDFGDDESGLSLKYLRRGSGYYIDVGASELIADGRVAMRSGVDVRELTEDGVVLSDGSFLPADLVVYATGYGSMNGWAAQLISQRVADKVGRCWGLGSGTTKDPGPWEGELRNMWKPTRQDGLWFHGGNLAQSRHYSRYLALQLKARLEGIATLVHALAEVHHLS